MTFWYLRIDKRWSLILLATVLILSLIPLALVYADNFGREDCHGYFEDKGECSGKWLPNDDYNVIKDGLLPNNLNDSSSKFYNFVKGRYDSNSDQDKTGVAFIVNTMLGKDADGYGREISKSVWAEFKMKLDYIYKVGKVDWDSNYKICGKTFTYYQPDHNDVAFYDLKKSMVEDYYQDYYEGKGYTGDELADKVDNKVDNYCESKVLVFRDKDDDVVYRLNKDCANPVGNLSDKGLPAPKYELDPNVTLNPSDAVENNVDYNVTPSISNNGTLTRDTQWRLTKLTASSGRNISPDSDSRDSKAPCSFYISDTCDTIKSGEAIFDTDGSVESKISGDDFSGYSSNTGSALLGTEVCFVLSVKPWSTHDPYSESDEDWRHSDTQCFKIVKKPKVQILGGDLVSFNQIQTSTTDKNISGTRRFGSWGEYGIFASGSILGMASGSAYAGIPGLVNSAVCNYSQLSFANVRPDGLACGDGSGGIATVGNYQNLPTIPNVAGSFSASGMAIFDEVVANNLPKNSPDSVTDIYHAVGDLILDASTLSAGRSIVIKVSGTVTITGDQEYNDGPYNRISQIPQLVIIANKIVINSNVTKVNAWLVAHNDAKTGEIYTCEIVGDTASKCKDKLIVNGPVMTDKLYLYRTAGSGSGDKSGDPAEVFNLRSDAYLWALSQAKNGNHVRTVYITELPPRY